MSFMENVFLNMLLKFLFWISCIYFEKISRLSWVKFRNIENVFFLLFKIFFSFFLFSLFFYNYFETICFPVTTWNIYFHGFEKLLSSLKFFLRFRTFFSILKIFSRFWKKFLFFKKIFFVERFGFHRYLFCGKQS